MYVIIYLFIFLKVAVIEMTSSVNDESRGHDDSESGAELNNTAEESILNLLVDRWVDLLKENFTTRWQTHKSQINYRIG